jgi:hypothetical protein
MLRFASRLVEQSMYLAEQCGLQRYDSLCSLKEEVDQMCISKKWVFSLTGQPQREISIKVFRTCSDWKKCQSFPTLVAGYAF